MVAFFERFYTIVATLLLLGIVVLSFLLGREEGRRSTPSPVLLSCENLSIAPSQKDSSSVSESATESAGYGSIRETVQGGEASSVKGAFVGSKNGTKYYRPECPGVARIKPENYIWFTSGQDAKLQGYTPAQC